MPWQEQLKLIITKFTNEGIVFSLGLLSIVAIIIIIYWQYNRRKFQKLSHQIPASVVKNYLDSIIQNSTSLKSSLFRGGGLDLTEGIPSVVPVGDLPSSNSVDTGISSEELNQKIAEISSLRTTVGEKESLIKDLEKSLSDLKAASTGDSVEEITKLNDEIAALKKKLEEKDAAAANSEGGDVELQGKFDEVSKERDELKERLMEYEIIEEDLANLKRLQQENEELKKSLEALKGGDTAPAPAPAPEPETVAEPEPAPEPEAVAEPEPAPEPEAVAEPEPEVPAEETPVEAAADELGVPQEEGEQKSAEELLSEFEKMLG